MFSETPDTIISEHVWYPDLSLYCDLCKEFIFVENLPDHRKMHHFLEELDIMSEQPSMEELATKRNLAVNRLDSKSGASKLSAVKICEFTSQSTCILISRDYKDARPVFNLITKRFLPAISP